MLKIVLSWGGGGALSLPTRAIATGDLSGLQTPGPLILAISLHDDVGCHKFVSIEPTYKKS